MSQIPNFGIVSTGIFGGILSNEYKMTDQAQEYLTMLCETITNRSVGSQWNIQATTYFKGQLEN